VKKPFDGSESCVARRLSANRAFNRIELFVVIAICTILAIILILPALARAKFTSHGANCVFNFKQWATMANIYASDDPKGRYPAFGALGSDGNPCDVSTNFIPAMVPYGMVVPMYYCPVRHQEFEADEKESTKVDSDRLRTRALCSNLCCGTVNAKAGWF